MVVLLAFVVSGSLADFMDQNSAEPIDSMSPLSGLFHTNKMTKRFGTYGFLLTHYGRRGGNGQKTSALDTATPASLSELLPASTASSAGDAENFPQSEWKLVRIFSPISSAYAIISRD